MLSRLRFLRRLPGWLTRAVSLLAFGIAAVDRLRQDVTRRRRAAGSARGEARARARRTLPSLYDRYPQALSAARRPGGLQTVPIERIVGTARRPSQNTADFLPLPGLRGRNWAARWQRILRANDQLVTLPPVELLKVGDEYFVSDGHNRVAAALVNGAVGVDADVTELILPGVLASPPAHAVRSSLVGGEELRQAGSGRLSRTATRTELGDELRRRDLLGTGREDAEPPAST